MEGCHAFAPVRDKGLGRLTHLREIAREGGRDLARAGIGQHGTSVETGVVICHGLDDLRPQLASSLTSMSPGRGVFGCEWVTCAWGMREGSAPEGAGAMGLLSRFG